MEEIAKSVAYEEETIQVWKDVQATLKLGKFNLRKFICNNDVVTGKIPDEHRSETKNKTFEVELHTSGHAVECAY